MQDGFADLTELERRSRVPPGELDRIVRGLVDAYDPLCIYLFGSFAWGTPRWYSDLDFCCIVRTDEEAENMEKASRVFGDFIRRETDFYLCSKKQFEKCLSNPATMEFKILHDANVLYAVPDVVFDLNQPLYREEYDLLRKATSNLNVAQRCLKAPPEIEMTLFHVQQSIEFSLRAFRAFHLQPLLKTHELKLLRKMCGNMEPAIKDIEGFSCRAAERLARYYFLRYDHKVKIPTSLAGVEEEMAIAGRVYEFVKHYIETTDPPTEPTIVSEDESERDA